MIEKKSNKERKRNIFLKNNSKKKIPSPGAERIDLFRLSLPPSCFSHRTDQRAQHPSCFLLPFFGPGEREREREREREGARRREKKNFAFGSPALANQLTSAAAPISSFHCDCVLIGPLSRNPSSPPPPR